MARPRTLLVGGLIVILGVAWYIFRPETAFIDRVADDPPPEGQAAVLLAGTFGPREHDGRGRAEVLALDDGRRVLRFSDFETIDGPDLHVYLVASADVTDSASLDAAAALPLGRLRGNIGPQNYEIPSGADLSRYHAATVWCDRFGVNFTTAPLSAP